MLPIKDLKKEIRYKSHTNNPLARFVSYETVALLFNIKEEDIYRVECWKHIVYVHGKGLSRFVSYADFPPIIEADPPTTQDFTRWRKRWHKKKRTRIAPDFWVAFYNKKFEEANSLDHLEAWRDLLVSLESLLSRLAWQNLQQNYRYQKYLWQIRFY